MRFLLAVLLALVAVPASAQTCDVQAAVDAGGVQDFGGATCVVDEPVEVFNPVTLRNLNVQRTVIPAVRFYPVFHIVADDVLFENVTISGPESDWVYDSAVEAQHGIEVRGGTGITLRNVSVSGMPGDGFSILPVSGQPMNVRLEDVTAHQFIGRSGVSVSGGTNLYIRGSFDGSLAGINVEPDAAHWVVDGLLIENSTTSGHAWPPLVMAFGNGLRQNITVRDTHVGASSYSPVQVGYWGLDPALAPNNITFQRLSGSFGGAFFQIRRATNLFIRGSQIRGQKGHPAVWFESETFPYTGEVASNCFQGYSYAVKTGNIIGAPPGVSTANNFLRRCL